MEKLPPHNSQAEEIVLAAVLQDPKCFVLAKTTLDPGDFYYPTHRQIFAAAIALDKKNQPVDMTTVWIALSNSNQEEIKHKLGSILAQLFYGYNVEACCHEIKRNSIKRRFLSVLHEAITSVYDPESDIESILQETAEISLELSGKLQANHSEGLRLVNDILPEAITFLEQLNEEEDTCTLSTGIYDYDNLTGGVPKGGITILAGRPGAGKSTVAIEWLLNMARSQKSVALFSLEMSDIQVVLKLLARCNIEINPKTQIKASQLLRSRGLKNISDMSWLASSSEALSDLNFWIDPFSNPTVEYVRNKLTKLASLNQLPEVVAIDYIGLMASKQKYGNRVLELDNTVKELRVMAKDFNIALVLLAQVNRASEARGDKRPVLADLRESGGLEQEATQVVIIYNPLLHNPDADKVLELHVLKNRYGPTGKVTVGFEPQYGRLLNLA